jgi:hypothetical protein
VLEYLVLRTGAVVLVGIEGEDLARKQAVGLVVSIQHRNMRGDLAFE